jgi:hypothetical protein
MVFSSRSGELDWAWVKAAASSIAIPLAYQVLLCGAMCSLLGWGTSATRHRAYGRQPRISLVIYPPAAPRRLIQSMLAGRVALRQRSALV